MTPFLHLHWYREEHRLWFWGTGTKLNRFHPRMTHAQRAKLDGLPRWTWDVSFEDMRAYREEASYLQLVHALGAASLDAKQCAEGIIGWDWEEEEALGTIRGVGQLSPNAIQSLRERHGVGQLPWQKNSRAGPGDPL